MRNSVGHNNHSDQAAPRRVPAWLGYVAAFLIKAVLTAILVITYPVVPLGRFPVAYVLGIGVVAYFFGLGPAIFAFILAALAFDWFFVPPTGSLWPLAVTRLGWANWLAFLLGSALVAIGMLIIRRLTSSLMREIAEHVRTEEQLRIETDRFERIFSSDVIGTVIGTPDGRILRANDYYLNLIGYTREEVDAGQVRWDIITPEEYLPLDYKGIQELRDTGVTKPYEKEYVRKDGSRVWALIADVLMYGPEEEIFGFILDISARKRAETELRESEVKYRSLFETSPDAVFVIGTEGNVLSANPSAQALFGMTEEELRLAGRQGLVAPEDDRLAPLIEERERTGRTRGELTYVRKDGSRFEGEFTSAILPEAGRGFVFVRDITQRVRAEEELRRNREDLARAQAIAHIGSWRLDTRKNELIWSDEVYRIFGVESGTPLTYESFLSFVHPDDREYVDSKWQAGLRGKPYGIEHRICLPDGSVKWVRETAELEFASDGQLLGGFGTVQDITETVRLRQELHRALEATQQDRERIAAMEGIAEVGISARNLRDALSTITVRIREAMRSHSCTLLLYDEATDELEACAACNVPGIVGLRIPRCDCFVWTIFLSGGPSYIRDVRQTPLTRIPQVAEAGVKSVLGVPLIGRTGPLGVVYVDTLEERGFTPEEVRLLQTMASRTALVIENARLADELAKNFQMLQRALLPPSPPDIQGYRIATTYLPGARGAEIGGDFYDIFLTEDQHLAVLIGDVTGKGIPSASLAAATRSTLRAFAYDTSNPGESLTHTNAVVSSEVRDLTLFVTAFAAVIDHRTGRVLYSSAGHPPPAIWHRETGDAELVGLGDPPVGVLPKYEFQEHEIALTPGDKIIFYTDGLDEARHDGELFGLERVAQVIRENGSQSPEELVSLLVSAALGWADGQLQDDLAIVVIECEA